MSEQGSSGEAPGGAAADAVALRARQRHARDKGLVDAARAGDRTAFGQLYDEWVDSVYDRAIHAGASAAEAREITEQTFLITWRDLAKLKQPAAFGAKVMQVARRETLARVKGGEKIVPKSGPTAEDRLTRATSAADTASDPEAAAVLREAAHALDEQTRDILDLHFRLGLTRNEVAAVLGEQPDKVAQTITKLPPALAVLTRARVLWRGGSPEDEGLQEALAADELVTFNASAVRTINRYAKDNDRARARSLMGIPPVELFAAIPLADAPAGLKTAVASVLVVEAVPMDGSAFVKRDDKGDIVDAPKPPPPPDGSIRPGIENKRPTIDPQKAAVVAAAALAAERAADDETAAAAAADAAPAKSRRERKADTKDKAAAKAAAVAPAADDLADQPPTDLAARKTDPDRGSGTAAKVGGAAVAGAAIAGAGAAAAGVGEADDAAAADGPDSAPTTDTGAVSDGAEAGAADEPKTDEPKTDEPKTDPAASGATSGDPAKGDTAAKGDTPGSTRPKDKTVAAAGAGVAAGAAAASVVDKPAYGAGAAKVASGAAGSATEEGTAAGAGGDGPGSDDGDESSGGAGKWIAIAVAAVILIGLVAFFATRGDGDQQLATEGSSATTAPTTTKAPGTTKAPSPSTSSTTSSTVPTETTVATETTAVTTTPTSLDPPPTTNPPPTDPPPTEPVTTTTVKLPTIKKQLSVSTVIVYNDYDPNAPGSPKLSWEVEGPAIVTVVGPNFSSNDLAGVNRPVCPVPLEAGLCKVNAALPATFTYTMTVEPVGGGQKQPGQTFFTVQSM